MRSYRFFLTLLMGLMSVLAMQADPITQQQALQKAERYLKGRKGSLKLSPISNARKLAPRKPGVTSSQPAYYAFNRGEKEGFVLVAADDRIEPVLGYTDEGEFDYTEIPDNMRSWLNAQESYVRYLQEHPDYAPAKAPVHPAIPEMLTTRWNQGAPYNNLSPRKSNGSATVTGCVATAMAQVLYYQRSKSVTELQATIPAYTTWTLQLPVAEIPAGSPIDWDNMLDSYNGSSTDRQKQAVAQLMKYCGAAVKMDYNDSSGAQPGEVPGAFNTYFGYTNARIVWQSDYDETGWDNILYTELANGRVAYLGGYNQDYTSGHAFVCDGYDGNHCFHINWGWGGASNGFFLLTALNPSQQGIGGSEDGSGFTFGQNAVIGCEPTDYRNKALPISNTLVKSLCIENFDTNKDGIFTYGEAADVTDLGTVFQGKTTITTFNELYYFTSLKAISDDAFSGCTKLSSVKLPKKLTAIGNAAFSGCRVLKTLTLPDGVTSIGDEAFKDCRVLPTMTFPEGLTAIGNSAFNGCAAFTDIELPTSTSTIGDNAFGGCTKVTTVIVKSPTPQDLNIGTDIFRNADGAGLDYEKATLFVPQGTLANYAAAEPWKNFTTIREQRDIAHGRFGTLATGKQFFIYNVATGRYLSRGEAYGTQSVVNMEPMRYVFSRTASMPADTYYLTSPDTGKSGTLLFRTWSDNNVGKGIAACFVDGTLESNRSNAYWLVKEVKDGIYTIQIAATQANYNEQLFLGIDPNHDSGAAAPTYGTYSDISYAENERGCQWRLVPYDADDYALYLESQTLANLIALGVKAKVSTTAEQAVYDNGASTMAEITEAQYKLRQKLNLINFADATFRSIALRLWDTDSDGELSQSEAARVKDVGVTFQKNTAITTLEDLQYFTGLTTISANSFQQCTKVTAVKLPQTITTIDNYAFNGCSKLASIELPLGVRKIGTGAFTGCTALKNVSVSAAIPADIRLVGSIFTANYISNATLNVPFGTKELYAEAATWKNFGTIQETRTHVNAPFSPIEPIVIGYIYNVGQQRYICGGEAYGTQAVVGDTPLPYTLQPVSASRPDVYTLAVSGSSKPYLFRTSTDAKIGEGTKGCFMDGSSMTNTAYWKLAAVEGSDLFFTLQVPATDNTYVEGEYLGVQTNHRSDYTSPTYGLYWDVNLEQEGENCHWAFIRKVDVDSVNTLNELGDELKLLLQRADAKQLDVTAERAVYDNAAATAEDLTAAIYNTKQKLGYIFFADARAEKLCINEWDTDHDGYLTTDEAAAVSDISTLFYNAGIKSLDELRYFTSLQEIPENAFRGNAALVSLYIPEGVKKIGANAFTSCSALKYIAVLTPSVPDASAINLNRTLTVFVPQALMADYKANEHWSLPEYLEYTGIPTVTAEDASRLYGRTNAAFKYTVTGAPINGIPVLTSDATATTPVGEYPIQVMAGSITTTGLLCIPGTLTIDKAAITVKAKSYSRQVGEANPEFEVTYSGFRNRETAEVLTKLATATCEATPDSPAGDYDIVPSGAEAENYEFTYVPGVLTVQAPVGVRDIKDDTAAPRDIYNIAGQRLTKPVRGVNIIDKKKVIVK